MEDERFSHVINDPKFRRIPKTERKVKIDKRFKSMFEDKQFKVKYTVDKRGRPVNHTSNEDLKRYYELDSDASSIESEEELGKYVKAPQSPIDNDNYNELNLKDKTDNQLSDEVKKRLKNLKVDYARGESNLFSDSSSDDEESESDKEEDVEHAWGALDNDAERTDEITHRFAACNMDWDRIRAVDLMVLLNSFLLPGQVIESVTIYPSEFGKKRMKEEELKGPVELVESKPLENEEEEEEENEEGSKFHMEKLRQYQLNRLKYYFAVIVCDNKDTANKIYIECDGLEYESSATKMDLRFIPDDMTFDDEPKEICNKLPEEGKYKPRFFTTTALQQAKVDLTWDETDPDRNEFIQKLASGGEIENNHLEAYLASSSEDSPEEDALIYNDDNDGANSKLTTVDKYKLLLQDIENKEKDKEKKGVEMEISWELNVKDNTEKLVKKKLEEKEGKTPFQQYLDKRKEKQKVKRNKNKQRHTSEGGDDSDFSLDVDMNDPYFAEEFNKPEFKQSKKRTSKIKTEEGDDENKQKEAELELLLLNAEDDKNHFSLEKILNNENRKKSKRKSRKNEVEDTIDEFKIDVRDARFSALYSSHHYNIDPTDPRYRKTKAVDAILNEKLKRRNEEHIEESTYNRSNGDTELHALVKSVQNKTKWYYDNLELQNEL
ncbi:hypothetical protein FQA39_LY10410 [Lamprigera yunnana]|nr:hypothetical protein FQA39_LY10410 [Lamprigera yunnana]